MFSRAGWDNHRDEGYVPYKYDENVARLPKDLLPAIPTAEANAPSGDRWTLAGSKYSSMLDEVIRTSSGLEDASRKTKKFIEEAIIANKLPSMDGLLKSMVQLTAEFASDEVRAAIEHCSKLIFSSLFDRKALINESIFFPDKDKEYEVIRYLKYAQTYCYIAVYTISNDNLAGVVYALFKKGVDVRIITDDETFSSKGSDIVALANAGIPIRTDRDLAARMHHKFVVIDDEVLLNGSFNWTYTAVTSNNENVVATSDAKLIKNFKTEFLRLWDLYKIGTVSGDGSVTKQLADYWVKYQTKEKYQKNSERSLLAQQLLPK